MKELTASIEKNTQLQLEIEIIKLGKTIMWSLCIIAICILGVISVKAYAGYQQTQICI